eukprot:Filipodium_phascolosomae@DN1398_c0_g1_i2.p2
MLPYKWKSYIYECCHIHIQMEAGTRTVLPLWLAEYLMIKSYAEVEMPAMFSMSILTGLQQDAAIMNVMDHSLYYFELGVRCGSLVRDEDVDLNAYASLSKTWLVALTWT